MSRTARSVSGEGRDRWKRGVSAGRITPLIQTKTGQPFNENTVGADAARIQGLYRQRGFAGVKVSAQNRARANGGGRRAVRVRLEIAEGPRSLIKSITFEGNSAITSRNPAPDHQLGAGPAVLRAPDASDADTLSVLYLNRGYPASPFSPSPRSRQTRQAWICDFVIHEGPQITHRPYFDRRQSAHQRDMIAARCSSKPGSRSLSRTRTKRGRASRRWGSSAASTSRICSCRAAEPSRRDHHRRRSAGDHDRVRRGARGRETDGRGSTAATRRGIPGGAARLLRGEPTESVREGSHR